MSGQLSDTSSRNRLSISNFLGHAWNSLAESVMQVGWAPLASVAEKAVVSAMRQITVGQLKLVTSECVYTFPEQSSSVGQDKSDARSGVKAELRVLRDTFWVRLCTMGDLGFSEAYMYGDVECDDLLSLFQLFLNNKANLEKLDSGIAYLFSLPQKWTSHSLMNTIGNSRSNIAAHYDISNDMFAGFLSPDMTYSCAIFKDLDGDLKKDRVDGWQGSGFLRNGNAQTFNDFDAKSDGCVHIANGNGATNTLTSGKHVNGNGHIHRINEDSQGNGHPDDNQKYRGLAEDDELYEAQMRKLDYIVNKAHIQPGHRVLEIGSGWGSMAIRITQRIPGTTVDTLTLSVQQQILAQKRISALGLSDRIKVHLMDYRNMPPEWEGAFDRLISIEMLEAVGEEFLETYWSTVDWALKPLTGAGVVQVITIPETRWDRYRTEVDFIQKWVCQSVPIVRTLKCSDINPQFFFVFFVDDIMILVFPGGMIPTLTLLMDTLRSGSKNRLIVDSVSNIGPHYARTLREWRRRFLDRFEDSIVPALQKDYLSVTGPSCGEQGRGEIEVFKRKWIYYYCYCEIGFTTRTIGDHIITFAREGYQDFGCDVVV